jgi:uncharacterized protein YcbK (DUF882 family)
MAKKKTTATSAPSEAKPANERTYRFFKLEEFDSPDAKGSGVNMQHSTVQMLDEARALAGIPFVVNSGFRTGSHNAAIGGSANSAHLRGFAVDIRCQSQTNFERVALAVIAVGFRRIGLHHSFIHVDNDPSLPTNTWQYNRQNVEEQYRLDFVRAAIKMADFLAVIK